MALGQVLVNNTTVTLSTITALQCLWGEVPLPWLLVSLWRDISHMAHPLIQMPQWKGGDFEMRGGYVWSAPLSSF